MRIYQWLSVVTIVLALAWCHSGSNQVMAAEINPRVDPAGKIAFDLNQLNAQGLHGPSDGLRALAYEFCIPRDPALEAEVKAIDPTVVVYAGSRGRVGCGPGENLCLGSTQQPEFKAVLLKLAGLTYVKQIKQCFFE
jgi:hypothetical protein